MNFSYALENAFVDYLSNNITSSYGYPILRGFNPTVMDAPESVVVHCSDFKESDGLEYSGNMNATLHVMVETNFLDVSGSVMHDQVVGEVDRLSRAGYSVQNWINNPSSSMYINGMTFDGVSNVIKDMSWETQYHFRIAGQQMFTTSSKSTLDIV